MMHLKLIKRTLITTVMLLCVFGSVKAINRETILWNFDWKFQQGEVNGGESTALDDSGWTTLNLPHDYLLNSPWDETASRARGFKKQTSGWYRKSFTPDESWKGRKVILDFQGLMYYGDVYINGKLVGGTDYGYCGFECDITDELKYGEKNVVAVYTNTGVDGGSRWYTGGGINRDVNLIVKNEVSLSRHGVYATAEKCADGSSWSVNVQAEMNGDILKGRKLQLQARILDAEGKEIAECITKECPSQGRQSLIEVPIGQLTVSDAHLWNLDDPYLYTVEVKLYDGQKESDCVTTRIGLRTIEYGPDFGFKLNGKKVFLQGISNHCDFGGVGVAAFRSAIKRQLEQLKPFGFNAVRCSHNPYPEQFYDLCDEMGILVVDEFVDKWSGDDRNCWGGREKFLSCWAPLLQEWVKRDRNHPCVILWSLGNEMQHRENASGYMTGDWGVTTFRILDVMLKRYDTTRPSTAAMYPARANGIRRHDEGFRDEANILPPELSCITQVASYNYEYADYRRYKKEQPHLIIFQSEASVNDLITPYLRMDKPSTVGLCYWGAIEYWGESDGWPKKGWNYSFFDHTLKAYPRAWLLESVYKDTPIVHIGVLDSEQKSIIWNDVLSGRAEMSHFYWKEHKGDSITLEVYSNAEEVELRQNGKLVGVKKNNFNDDKVQNKFLFNNLSWEPGSVVAIARNNGKEVARHELRSPGKAAKLQMTCETPNNWRADGMDLQYIRLQVVDAKGNEVNNYEGEIKIDIQGEAELTALDNGDHFTNLRLDQPSTSLYRGGALAIVRSTRKAGKVTIKATATGLKSVSTTLTTLQ